tara:strand:- start:10 stop:246 length:237 start_codon:yes stop_codon:yes gene_type:complete
LPDFDVRLKSNDPLDIERYLDARLTGPKKLDSYTVATLPSASDYFNTAIIVSDETGGRTIATSDGSNWKRVKDGATVS